MSAAAKRAPAAHSVRNTKLLTADQLASHPWMTTYKVLSCLLLFQYSAAGTNTLRPTAPAGISIIS
jgi:hypothetical protein